MKRSLFLVIALLLSLSFYSKEVSYNDALKTASSFFSASSSPASASKISAKRSRSGQGDLSLSMTGTQSDGKPAFYIINNGTKGFVIVSADDNTKQILGYSNSAAFVPEDIPAHVQFWLERYAHEIEMASDEKPLTSTGPSAKYEPIEPLLGNIQHDQGEPYNNQCPLIGNERTVTGCVATAAGQIMTYHKYPAKGKGQVSYTWNNTTLAVDLDNSTYNWDNILPKYVKNNYTSNYNSTQEAAISSLLRDIGYSCNMKYGLARSNGSSASDMVMGRALVNNFSYDKSLRRVMYNASYTPDPNGPTTSCTWNTEADILDAIYSNLKAGLPVMIGGQGPNNGGGHEFVGDGMDADGLLHINWGWAGVANGYYQLTSLIPKQSGTGAGMGQYTESISILMGIKPIKSGEVGSTESPLSVGLRNQHYIATSNEFTKSSTSLSSFFQVKTNYNDNSVPLNQFDIWNLGCFEITKLGFGYAISKENVAVKGVQAPYYIGSNNAEEGWAANYFRFSAGVYRGWGNNITPKTSVSNLVSGLATGVYDMEMAVKDADQTNYSAVYVWDRGRVRNKLAVGKDKVYIYPVSAANYSRDNSPTGLAVTAKDGSYTLSWSGTSSKYLLLTWKENDDLTVEPLTTTKKEGVAEGTNWAVFACEDNNNLIYAISDVAYGDVVSNTGGESGSGESGEDGKVEGVERVSYSSIVFSLKTRYDSLVGGRGVFSVNNRGTKVTFATGNLQYQASTKEWRFASEQWETIGSANAQISSDNEGWIDLFGWGTSGYHDASDPCNVNYQPYATSSAAQSSTCGTNNKYGYGPTNTMGVMDLTGDFASYDWGFHNKTSTDYTRYDIASEKPYAVSNESKGCVRYPAGMWRVLSRDEWAYIFNTRKVEYGEKLGWCIATIQDKSVVGLLLFPDGFSLRKYTNTGLNASCYGSKITITLNAWKYLEALGCVFLPCTGVRSGTSVSSTTNGYYWSATAGNDGSSASAAYSIYFQGSGTNTSALNTASERERYEGCAVRLVHTLKGNKIADYNVALKPENECSNYCEDVRTETKDTSVTLCGDENGFDWQIDNTTRPYALEDGETEREFSDTLRTQGGCDSIIYNVTLRKITWKVRRDSYEVTMAVGSSCDWNLGYKTLPCTLTTEEGADFYDTLRSKISGCDSVISHLKVHAKNSGRFSVGEGQKVDFAPGNLQFQASTGTWRFAEHQYDIIGDGNANIAENYAGWIDLFGWGTSGKGTDPSRSYPWKKLFESYGPESGNFDAASSEENRSYDWGYANEIYEGSIKHPAKTWRTPTSAEWDYLINTRRINDNKPYSFVNLQYSSGSSIDGVLIYPDGFTFAGAGVEKAIEMGNKKSNPGSVDAATWTKLEAAGCVFLPRTPYRDGSSIENHYGIYWTSTNTSQNNDARSVNWFGQDDPVISTGSDRKYYGFAVRLVADREQSTDACDNVICKHNDTTVVLTKGATSFTWNMGYKTRTFTLDEGKTRQEFGDTLRTANGLCDSIISHLTLSLPTFAVSEKEDVQISFGNLQYQPSTQKWRFAPTQYERCGVNNNNPSANSTNWIDLFGWGTSGKEGARPPYYTSTTGSDYSWSDWGQNEISGYPAGTWRTPTSEDWTYMLTVRTVNGGAPYSFVRIKYGDNDNDTVTGVVIYPNDFTWKNAGVDAIAVGAEAGIQAINAITWSRLDNAGCIFLPSAAYRDGAEINADFLGYTSYYWSSTEVNGSINVARFNVSSNSINPAYTLNKRHYGFPVRLIKNVGDPCDGMKVETRDTVVIPCDGTSMTWTLGSKSKQVDIPAGQTQTTFDDTLRTKDGCDSIIYNVTLRKKTWELTRKDTTVILKDGATSFSWKVDNTTLPGSLTANEAQKDFYDTLRAKVGGCDSVIYHLKLQIENKVAISVSDTRQVIFSPGNLQFQGSTGTWRFGEHQYDRCGMGGNESTVYWNNDGTPTKSDNSKIASDYAGWIDLFGWGTSGKGTSVDRSYPWKTSDNSANYGPESGSFDAKSGDNRSYDWGYANEIMEGSQKHPAQTWRTPNQEEWTHILTQRAKLNGNDPYSFVLLRFGSGDHDTVTGVIIYPDGFTFANAGVTAITTGASAITSLNVETWAKLETAGCVFLPGCAYRNGTSVTNNFAVNANYWSSSSPSGSTSNAYKVKFYFQEKKIEAPGTDGRRYAFPVRLIQNIATPCDAIEVETRDTTIIPCDGSTKMTWTLGSKSKQVSLENNETQKEFSDTLRSVEGCDSIIYNVTLRKKTWSSKNIDTTVMPCDGSIKYTWNMPGYKEREFELEGNATRQVLSDTLRSKVGNCDSIYYNLTLIKKTWELKQKDTTVILKDGATSFTWKVDNRTISGSLTANEAQKHFYDTLRAKVGGCDSVIYHLKLMNEDKVAVSIPDGKKVIFASGNLQYQGSTKTWRFAEHPYDTIGTGNTKIAQNYDGWIDLFGWGTSGKGTEVSRSYPWMTSTTSSAYGPESGDFDVNSEANRSYDWGYANEIMEGSMKYPAGTWRTPTTAEWAYIINTRRVNNSKPYTYVKLQYSSSRGTDGVIIYPDAFTFAGAGVNSITMANTNKDAMVTVDAATWAKLETAGCIFLPRTPFREGTALKDNTGIYWSSNNHTSAGKARSVNWFYKTDPIVSDGHDSKCNGLAVRLIQDLPTPCDKAEERDTLVVLCNGGNSYTWQLGSKSRPVTFGTNETEKTFEDTLLSKNGCDSIIYKVTVRKRTWELQQKDTVVLLKDVTNFSWNVGYKTLPCTLTGNEAQKDFYDTLRAKVGGCDSIICHIRLMVEDKVAVSIAENKRVIFAPGNLQYQGKTKKWRFAEHQYDRCGKGGTESTVYWYDNGVLTKTTNVNPSENYGGWIDLFGWGTSGINNANKPYYTSTSASNYSWSEWGDNKINDYPEGMWRTPTKDDWEYLLKTRKVNEDSGFSYVKLLHKDIIGVLIYPDAFTWQNAGVTKLQVGAKAGVQDITEDVWNKLESAGCVFLPNASRRNGTNVDDFFKTMAHYWSSTGSGSKAYKAEFFFNNNELKIHQDDRFYGNSVRLVKNLPTPCDQAEERDTLIVLCNGGNSYTWQLGSKSRPVTFGTNETEKTFEDTLLSKDGCDSIIYNVTLRRKAWELTRKDTTVILKDGATNFTWKVGNRTIPGSLTANEAQKDFYDTLRSKIGDCDSIIAHMRLMIADKVAISVSDDRQVIFSPGNLQYQGSTKTWRFAEHQYDMIGESNKNIAADYAGWIDLFGWGTSGVNGARPPYFSSKTENEYSWSEWGQNVIGSDPEGMWRTVKIDEWEHLLITRQVNGGAGYSFVTLTGPNVQGIIIYPDAFTFAKAGVSAITVGTSGSSSVNADVWAKLETAGCVFLPITGSRDGTEYTAGKTGYYWSSTAVDQNSTYAYQLKFGTDNPSISYNLSSLYRLGYAVRLVHNIFTPCDAIKTTTRDTTIMPCDGTSMTWTLGSNSREVSIPTGQTQTSFDDTIRTKNGLCDSIYYKVTLRKKAWSTETKDTTVTLYNNVKSYSWKMQGYKTKTVSLTNGVTEDEFKDTLRTKNKLCDSIYYHLTLRSVNWKLKWQDTTVVLKEGLSSYTWNMKGHRNHTFTLAANELQREFYDTLRSKVVGCDSIIYHLTLCIEREMTAEFSVSGRRKVFFAPGNLQYCAAQKKWRFGVRQFDRVGNGKQAVVPGGRNQTAGYGITTVFWDSLGYTVPCSNLRVSEKYGGWVDVFSWGTSGIGDARQPYFAGSRDDFSWSEWGQNAIGAKSANTWRTPSSTELDYLLNTRKVNGAAGWSLVNLKYGNNETDTITGMIIYPDNFTWSAAGVNAIPVGTGNYTAIEAATWTALEKVGCVFLPADIGRSYSYGKFSVNEPYYGLIAYYWTSTAYSRDLSEAYYVRFSSISRTISFADAYHSGSYTVRLVRNTVDDPCETWELENKDTTVILTEGKKSFAWNVGYKTLTWSLANNEAQKDFYDTLRAKKGGCDSIICHMRLMQQDKVTFSISNKNKVVFAPGNLQYCAAKDKWRFAERQYDNCSSGYDKTTVYWTDGYNVYKCNNAFVSETYGGWIDLFGWGTSGVEGANPPYFISQTNTDYTWSDWGQNMIGGHTPNTWRTLKSGEWDYLLNTRKVNEDTGFSYVALVYDQKTKYDGTLLYPDNFTWSAAGVNALPVGVSEKQTEIDVATWIALEKAGCVFLPHTSIRYVSGNTVSVGSENPSRAYYWTASADANVTTTAHIISIAYDNRKVNPASNANRYYGYAVRLVQNVGNQCGDIETEKRDTIIMPCDGNTKYTWTLGSKSREVSIPSGQTQTSFDDTLRTKDGKCDSIYYKVTLRKKTWELKRRDTVVMPCDGSTKYTWTLGSKSKLVEIPVGQTQTTFEDTLRSVEGCDSVIYKVTFRQKTWEKKEVPSPDAVVAVGETYEWKLPHTTKRYPVTEAGTQTFKDTLRSKIGGCDSIIYILNLTGAYAFSVESNKKVLFSPGNVQYQGSTKTWRFAPNQYDRCMANNNNASNTEYDGWIDLFGWGTGDNPNKTSTSNNDYSTFTDWGENKISGYPAKTWRTPTKDEWVYLINTRKVNNTTGYSYVRLKYGSGDADTCTGVLIYPDNFTWKDAGISSISVGSSAGVQNISATQWAALEKVGCVFLPGCSYRSGTTVSASRYGLDAYYWSATQNGTSIASCASFNFGGGSVNPAEGSSSRYGSAVRLIKKVGGQCGDIEIETRDTTIMPCDGSTKYTWKMPGYKDKEVELKNGVTKDVFKDTLRSKVGNCDSIYYKLTLYKKTWELKRRDTIVILTEGKTSFAWKVGTNTFTHSLAANEAQKDFYDTLRSKVGNCDSIICHLRLMIEDKVAVSVEDNKKVVFSPGNLQYQASTKTWRFAEHQYDYIGDDNAKAAQDYAGWIDLFGWGASGVEPGRPPYYKGTSAGDYSWSEWGQNVISGYPKDTWRTLTKDDWTYLLTTRKVNNKTAYSYVKLHNGITGVLIYPDKFTFANAGVTELNVGADKGVQTITEDTWNKLELAGCVFLPGASRRDGNTVNNFYTQHAHYWSSTANGYKAEFFFQDKRLQIHEDSKHYGNSVRLVQNIVTPCDAIQTTTRDTTIMPCDGATSFTWTLGSKSREVSIPNGQTQTTFDDTLRTKNGKCDSIYYKVTLRKKTWELKRRDTTVILTEGKTSFTWNIGHKNLTGSLSTNEAQKDFYDTLRAKVGGCDSIICHLKLRSENKVAISVSNTRKVIFSPGNLQFQASTGTWRFAEHQYDRCGAGGNETTVYWNNNGTQTKCNNALIANNYAGWIDLFGWGTSGKGTNADRSKPWLTSSNNSDYGPAEGSFDAKSGDNRSYDWGYANEIMEGTQKHPKGTWRTLNQEEWKHILTQRAKINGNDPYSFVLLRFGSGNHDTVRGVIIYPDGFTFTKASVSAITTGPSATTNISAAVWAKLETAGCVFLPGCAYRNGTSVANNFAVNANYWSSTANTSTDAYKVKFYFQDKKIEAPGTDGRKYAFPVRLIQNVGGPCDDIEIETRDTIIMPCDGTSMTWTLGSKSRQVSIPSGQTQTSFDDTVRTKDGLCDSIYYKVTLRKKTWEKKEIPSTAEVAVGEAYEWKLPHTTKPCTLTKETGDKFYDTVRSKIGGCDSIVYILTLNAKSTAGIFSVSPSQKVLFSPGNLQYQGSTKTWRFAPNQYDRCMANNNNASNTEYDGWIDLFGFGTGDNPNKTSTSNNDYATFTDWGSNVISGYAKDTWRTPTKDEWVYLINTRKVNNTTGYSYVRLTYGSGNADTCTGVIIYPDNFTWKDAGISSISVGASAGVKNISATQWAALEKVGCVFLPSCSSRAGATVSANLYGLNAYYWSATQYGPTAYFVLFNFAGGSINPANYSFRYNGFAVRLIQDLK